MFLVNQKGSCSSMIVDADAWHVWCWRNNTSDLRSTMVKFDPADKPKPYLTDSWIAILVGIILFNIPRSNPFRGAWLWKPPPGLCSEWNILFRLPRWLGPSTKDVRQNLGFSNHPPPRTSASGFSNYYFYTLFFSNYLF